MTSAETIVIVTTVTVPTLDATFLAFKKRDLEPRGVNDLAPRILRTTTHATTTHGSTTQAPKRTRSSCPEMSKKFSVDLVPSQADARACS